MSLWYQGDYINAFHNFTEMDPNEKKILWIGTKVSKLWPINFELCKLWLAYKYWISLELEQKKHPLIFGFDTGSA